MASHSISSWVLRGADKGHLMGDMGSWSAVFPVFLSHIGLSCAVEGDSLEKGSNEMGLC